MYPIQTYYTPQPNTHRYKLTQQPKQQYTQQNTNPYQTLQKQGVKILYNPKNTIENKLN